jgi:hypothetical protein
LQIKSCRGIQELVLKYSYRRFFYNEPGRRMGSPGLVKTAWNLNEVIMALNQKALGRSESSLIFGSCSWLKLVKLEVKLVFSDKNSCSLEKFVQKIFQYPSFYDFYFFLGVKKKKN